LQRTLKRDFKELEVVEGEANRGVTFFFKEFVCSVHSHPFGIQVGFPLPESGCHLALVANVSASIPGSARHKAKLGSVENLTGTGGGGSPSLFALAFSLLSLFAYTAPRIEAVCFAVVRRHKIRKRRFFFLVLSPPPFPFFLPFFRFSLPSRGGGGGGKGGGGGRVGQTGLDFQKKHAAFSF